MSQIIQLNCYQIIKSYIDNKYNECHDIFSNPNNHKIIQFRRIPHKMIIKLLETVVSNNDATLAQNIIGYIIAYKLNYFKEYTEIFNTSCEKGSISIVKLFLKYQNIIYPNFKKNSILKNAIKYNQLEVVKLLMNNGRVLKKLRPEMLSDFYVNNDAYKYFIGHDVNKNMRNESVIIRAITSNDNEVARIILNANIIHDININDECIIRIAMYHNNLEVVKMILDYKQKPNMELFKCGFTHACFKGNVEVVEHILQNSAIKEYDIKYINALCGILFPYIDINSNVTKVISLLVEHDLINNNLINYIKCHKSTDFYLKSVTGIGKLSIYYNYFIDYSLNAKHIQSNHLLDQLLWIYKQRTPNDSWEHILHIHKQCNSKQTVYNQSICIFLQNKKLNKCYDQIILLLGSKVELFEQNGIPGEIINQIVANMCNLLCYEYMEL